MIFEQHYLECLSQASYLIGDEDTGRAVVVDPRRDVAPYLESAAEHGLNDRDGDRDPLHADFLSGHLELAAATGAEIATDPGPRRSSTSASSNTANASISARSSSRSATLPAHPGVDLHRRPRRRRRALRRAHRRHPVHR